MASIQIPNLPAAVGLTGNEELEIVQVGESKRTTTGAVAALAVYDAPTATDGVDYYIALRSGRVVKAPSTDKEATNYGVSADNDPDANGAILEGLISSGTSDIAMAYGSATGMSIQLYDGDHIRLDMGVLSRIIATTALPALDIYTVPVWTIDVSSIVIQNNVNLVEPGNTPNPINTVAVINLPVGQAVSRGELLLITSDDEVPGTRRDSPTVVCREGEFVTAALDSTGTSITLTAPLRGAYTTNVKISKVPIASVSIEGAVGSYDPAIPIGLNSPIVRLTGLVGSNVDNWTALRYITRGFQLIGCFGTELTRGYSSNHSNDPVNDNYGYAFDIVACEGTKLVSFTGHHNRHNPTTNNINLPAGTTGVNLYKHGRTRGTIYAAATGSAGQSSGFDYHDDADGAISIGVYVSNGYAGAVSEGAGLSARGRNTGFANSIVDNCLSGVVTFAQENGSFVNCTVRRARRFALAVDYGNIATNVNMQNSFTGGYYEVENPTDTSVVRLTSMPGKISTVNIDGGLIIAPKGDVSANSCIFNIRQPGVRLAVDAIIDMTGVTAQGTLDVFRIEDAVGDDLTIDGELKIIGATSTFQQLLKTASGLSCTGQINLKISYVGTNDFSAGSAINPFGVSSSEFTNYQIGGSAIGASIRYTRDFTYSVSPAATVSLGGYGDDEITVNLVPSADCTGTNALPINLTNVKRSQIINIRNNSVYVVQLSTNANITIAPGATVSFHVPNYSSTPFMVLVSKGAIPGIITKTSSFSTSQRDDGAFFNLSNAASTQLVTLAATSTVGTLITGYQGDVGYWTFQSTGSGSVISLGGALKTGGQNAYWSAQVIANSGGSAAVWLLSGDIVV